MIKIVQKRGENLRFDNLVITSLYKRISNSIQGAFLICFFLQVFSENLGENIPSDKNILNNLLEECVC